MFICFPVKKKEVIKGVKTQPLLELYWKQGIQIKEDLFHCAQREIRKTNHKLCKESNEVYVSNLACC